MLMLMQYLRSRLISVEPTLNLKTRLLFCQCAACAHHGQLAERKGWQKTTGFARVLSLPFAEGSPVWE